ncbi:hypothetical protein [Psychrobacter sp. M13]|uniref:hypothetical protein n=1 Tax=Psychrobacter sp. M13 TaxID=3067275 RepID=UPI00273A81AF|nr:hypothetical protein [Psychrobacter sp. M13]WLP94278.1 hypothetical protein Q9G97_11950 [Psychrobacter sp. M13]
MIPSIAEQNIHQVLIKKMSIQSFERWLYEDDVLESSNPDLYFELISFDYSSESNFKNFYDSFTKYVHFYKFEADHIAEYLYSIINRDEGCSKAIHEMYYLYYDGYKFFEKLGMIYGVSLIDFDTLIASDNLDNILDKFYPDIIDDAKNVLSWLEEDKIVFKDESSEYGGFEYDDLRSEAEVLQGKA